MDRSVSSVTFILVFIFGAFCFIHPFVDSREFRRETACYNDNLHLDCGKSVIAVHEAYFTTASKKENLTCHSPALEHDYIEDNAESEDVAVNESVCLEDVRVSLNRKCSGFKSCNYSYSQLPEKNCYNSEGLLVVRFDCVKESNINKWCNSKILTPEGYISSPGYPQYYPQLTSCVWSMIASEGQTIHASVLHLHLREAVDVTPTQTNNEMEFHLIGQLVEVVKRCDDDKLTIYEGVVRRAELCGEGVEAMKSVEVEGVAGMEVRFRSAAFNPASGFLVYFKTHGCPTLPPGEGIRLVERNGSAATYACRNKRQVFNDTLQGTRFLQCVRDHHWNDTLPPCVAMEDTTLSTLTAISSTELDEKFGNYSRNDDEEMNPLLDNKANLIADIIIPVVIILVLLIINCIVLVIIFVVRRRQKPIENEFEELSDDPPPPLVSEEKFEEESPPTSSKQTSSKRVTIKSPEISPQESESDPTFSQAKSSISPPESDPEPTFSQAKSSSEDTSDSHPLTSEGPTNESS
ncbi:hypothetical protein JTE90_006586 [Oedothorax gibbosus]|uniref:Uncharacterized protein n=1 Tax=Oedothorax gibbosus TaxID=931172 RepID=A0AAV6VIP8_9ARAC|nr:hypothetical protein JTE90_006586 [Oedothorax gibbosus]